MTALLFLHGFAGAPSTFDAVRAELGGERPAIAPWLGGHGPEPASESFDAEVDRLLTAAQSSLGPRFTVVGYSLGARLGLRMALRHPSAVVTAVLVGVHAGLSDDLERRQRILADERWAALLEREGMERFEELWAAQPVFDSQRDLPEELRAGQRATRRDHDPARLAAAMRTLGLASMPPSEPLLGTCRVPVALVAGERDGKFRALAARLALALPRGSVHLVAGAGHNPCLERPAALAQLLRELVPT